MTISAARLLSLLIMTVAVTTVSVLASAQVLPNAQLAAPPSPPPGFIPPPLNPTGVQLQTQQLDEGVYALLSNTPFADNAGFIVGNDAVLVIDSHFNGIMGQQIIAAVRAVTDLPIRYLLNTNAFGDHVFGNYVFPAQTQIVAHQGTIDALKISTVAGIARTMRGTVGGDMSVFEGVELRLPDIGFDQYWSVDLGGKIIEMHWFGPSMSPHDSVVYLPNEKIAWTANLIFGAGTIPWARSGGVAAYHSTLTKMAATIAPTTIVSGHGAITDGKAVTAYLTYLDQVMASAAQAVERGDSAASLYASATLSDNLSIAPSLQQLMTGFHRWNLQAAFAEAKQAQTSQARQPVAQP
ncbi:MAG: MBL fold metallo-hydrolase [Proteobacteria bacterium]|nr:MBL fold metallo-hydrolase [Pseudomonadota bacterium]